MLHEMATIYKKAWGREPLDIVVAAKQKISSKISSAIGRKASDSRQGTTTGYAEFSRHALQRTSVSLPQAMHIYRIAAAILTVSVRHQHQVQSDLHIDGNRKHGTMPSSERSARSGTYCHGARSSFGTNVLPK